ncbi:hypothetical protein ACIPY5_15010 [Microbacterium sp. NPDC089698]|uniref:hypothetical protein n=1 Tax=Microbacterium sp. NPDC089698 TaxID=3364200 RepID=UPI003804B5E4
MKLLFAHADRKDPKAEAANYASETRNSRSESTVADDGWAMPSSDAAPRADAGEPATQLPTLYVQARTRANVFAAIRALSELPHTMDLIDDDDDYKYWNPYVATYHGSRRDLVEYRERLQASHPPDLEEITRVERQLDYQDQAYEQRVADVLLSALFTLLPVQGQYVWSLLRDRLRAAPYVFDLGALPEAGRSHAFKQNLRQLLDERRNRYPELFPMRAKSGISMVVFEGGDHGKDLDNLIRTVLPDILDVLRPPRTDRPGWVATAPDIESTYPDIPFIEVAAIPAKDADPPPGTVVFGLSGGHRYQSWWAKAESDLERQLEHLIERD